MEPIRITITKDGRDILIASSEGRQIKIISTNNELKASETIEFLNYEDNKKYELVELTEETKSDKNLCYVYEVFRSIIEKINPIEEIE